MVFPHLLFPVFYIDWCWFFLIIILRLFRFLCVCFECGATCWHCCLNTLNIFDSDWHSRPKHTHRVCTVNSILTNKKPHKKINIKIKSMIFYWAQSHWIIKPVCDILKWASYFIIDWQIVTILTQSLTFCRTCRPKSCFWPFSHFIHSDSAPHAVNI